MKAPKDLAANLAYRQRVLKLCQHDREAQREFWIASSRDIVFWLDTFGWTFAQKFFPDAPDRPFILWPFQEDALRKIQAAIGKHDLLVEKSRDMGGTVLCIAAITHHWLFKPGQNFLLGSRKQELVDKSGDPKCLFWRVDYLLGHLPVWMRPRTMLRNSMHLERDSHSIIDGESTNDDFARGDRRQAILLDEFPAVDNGHKILSATRDATNCRIFLGTPQGASGAYYETRQKMLKMNPEHVLSLHWSLHPLKNVGMEMRDGKPWSPWYQGERDRAATPQEIAQELDIDYAASSWRAMDPAVLKQLLEDQPRTPLAKGKLLYRPGEAGKWMAMEQGDILLWTHLIDGQPPADDDYVVGCDISAGKGGEMSSRSVASVYSRKTRTKVAELKTGNHDPADFAEYVVALCLWFRGQSGSGAHLIWEAPGPGETFGARVVQRLRYMNIYYRANEQKAGRPKTSTPGWFPTLEGKNTLLRDYFKALKDGEIINRSREALEETAEYDTDPQGNISHAGSRSAQNPSVKGKNHGDIVIGDALAYRALQDFGAQPEAEEVVIPVSCFQQRMQDRARQRKKASLY